jgi:hypothetical protein
MSGPVRSGVDGRVGGVVLWGEGWRVVNWAWVAGEVESEGQGA